MPQSLLIDSSFWNQTSGSEHLTAVYLLGPSDKPGQRQDATLYSYEIVVIYAQLHARPHWHATIYI